MIINLQQDLKSVQLFQNNRQFKTFLSFFHFKFRNLKNSSYRECIAHN